MLKELWKHKNSNTVARNYLALLLIQGSNFILPLITLPYLVRTLGSEKYGLVMIAQSLAVFLTIIVDFGFNISATREVSLLRKDKDKLSQFYWNVFFIKCCLVLITFTILLFLIYSISRFKVEPLVYLFSFGAVVGQAIFPAWFFQGIEKMKVITVVNVLAKLIFTIAIFVFILSPKDYELVPLWNGAGFIFTGIIGLFFSFKYIYFKRPRFNQIKFIVKDTFNLFVSNFAISLYTSSNTFILGMFAGDTIAGVYASMEKLIIAMKSIYTPLYQAIFPWLATLTKDKIRAFVTKIKLPIAFSAITITCIILFSSKPLLNFVYADNLITSYSLILQILAFVAIFSSLNMLYVSLYFPALKLYKTRMYLMVFGGIFNFILVLIAVNFYEIYGVAVVATITELFILTLAHYFFKKTANQ